MFDNNNRSDNKIADQLTGQVKTCSFSQGMNWLKLGFNLFKLNPLQWMLSTLSVLLLSLALMAIPVVGSIIASILWAGFYVIARNLDRGDKFNPMDIIQTVKTSGLKLAGLTLINLVVMSVCFAIMLGDFPINDPEQLKQLSDTEILKLAEQFVLAMFIYLIPAAAFVFSPILLALQPQVSLINTIIQSFRACLLNVLAMLGFGLAMIGLAFPALVLITLNLTLLVPLYFMLLVPITMCALYCAYKDIYCQVNEDPNSSDNDINSSNDSNNSDVMQA
ncbi:hypothetical protein HR060_03930 [Catenovulum sp. SM1970]|uniref:BPSS1780 family membrane protein n=1 Tax=Marinifaba aquimaris TaxID=2741323 RepID=UPI001572B401|nr:BPSS1780 family membrane protein [Marinifaba aquimaris]NTS76008.1 hypothetical protein [Marinifaba aquimaris]